MNFVQSDADIMQQFEEAAERTEGPIYCKVLTEDDCIIVNSVLSFTMSELPEIPKVIYKNRGINDPDQAMERFQQLTDLFLC